jgi:hypothetical protein
MSQPALETLSERELVQRAVGDMDAYAFLDRLRITFAAASDTPAAELPMSTCDLAGW